MSEDWEKCTKPLDSMYYSRMICLSLELTKNSHAKEIWIQVGNKSFHQKREPVIYVHIDRQSIPIKFLGGIVKCLVCDRHEILDNLRSS